MAGDEDDCEILPDDENLIVGHLVTPREVVPADVKVPRNATLVDIRFAGLLPRLSVVGDVGLAGMLAKYSSHAKSDVPWTSPHHC
jgi:hypothetical protein